jgi:hypothetical protein
MLKDPNSEEREKKGRNKMKINKEQGKIAEKKKRSSVGYCTTLSARLG